MPSQTASHQLGVRLDFARARNVHFRSSEYRLEIATPGWVVATPTIFVGHAAGGDALTSAIYTMRGSRLPSTMSVIDEHQSVDQLVLAMHTRRPWVRAWRDRIEHLLDLPANWNSSGEERVHINAVAHATKIVDELDYDGPDINLVPLADGGVLIEWIRGDDAIELEVSAHDHAHAVVAVGGAEVERIVTTYDDARWLGDEVRRFLTQGA
ncbi:MAG TPA: hypothetical protein VHC63_13560 [Acidimicrobiales bacterium]|nr:hypothetical protein [Acidimicrobiales bacterium]